MDKIKNLFEITRTIKKEIKHNGENFRFYLKKDSPAKTSFGKIIVDDIFMNTFNKKEKIAIFYHERYHKRPFTPFKTLFYLIRYFSFKKASWKEEFDADIYGVKNTSKEVMVSQLKKSKKLYQKGIVKYNPKTHPPINERIKKVIGYFDKNTK